GASWHDEYKDSAYIFVGGLHFDLTEGDVITIFSQYGEVLDLNMPRDKETGKRKGFAFLMSWKRRSVLIMSRTTNSPNQNEEGEWVDPEEQSLNAKPEMVIDDGGESDSSASTGAEQKALKKDKKAKGKGKHKDETPEERRARKARKKEKKAKKIKSAGMKGVEDLLNSLGRPPPPPPDSPRSDARSDRHRRYSPARSRSRRSVSRSASPRRRSRSPERDRERPYKDDRYRPRDSRPLDDDERRSYGHQSRPERHPRA
ncbi:hypothetical protein BJ912DRAFT_1070165, partial [Pholiota molesta]